MTDRGFVLVEWLIASTFVLILAGAIFSMVTPVRDAIERGRHSIDMTMSARAALDMIVSDARQSGRGAAIAPAGGDLAALLPPVVPYDNLDGATIAQSGTAILLRTTPHAGAQGRLRMAVSAGDVFLPLDTDARCSSGAPACGFLPGESAVLFTTTMAEVVEIESAVIGGVVLAFPLTGSFPPEAVLCRLVETTYGLRRDGALIRVSEGGAEQPLINNVVVFEAGVDNMDVTRARVLSLRVRIEAASAELRGPAGYLFINAGTSQNSRRWLPDVELRTQVALRNAGGTW